MYVQGSICKGCDLLVFSHKDLKEKNKMYIIFYFLYIFLVKVLRDLLEFFSIASIILQCYFLLSF